MQHIKEILPSYAEKLLAKAQRKQDIEEMGYDNKNWTIARIHERPDCDFCGLSASYDAKCLNGLWGYLCGQCFKDQKGKLGCGLGQKLIIK